MRAGRARASYGRERGSLEAVDELEAEVADDGRHDDGEHRADEQRPPRLEPRGQRAHGRLPGIAAQNLAATLVSSKVSGRVWKCFQPT